MVVVLGIDPGTANTGYGVVVARGPKLGALDGGTIETAAGVPLEQRLVRIHERVLELIAEHEPQAVAIEELYFGQNARSALAVGQARGAVLLAASSRSSRRSAARGRPRRTRSADGRGVARAAGHTEARSRGGRARRRHLPRQRSEPAGQPGGVIGPSRAGARHGACFLARQALGSRSGGVRCAAQNHGL